MTLDNGLPHGRACAVWLPTAWRLATGLDSGVDHLLAQLFAGDNGLAALQIWLERVGVNARPEAVGVTDTPTRIAAALSSVRGRNFVGANALQSAHVPPS